MKSLAFLMIGALSFPALTLPTAALAQRVNVTLVPGRNIIFDKGCMVGSLGSDRFPTTVYDAKTHDRITFNLSRCTGGYITGRNEDSGRSWNADITPDGVITGRDLDGHRWRYDPHARLYTNLDTHRTCAQTSVRQVCAV